jgi:hypothetical protein
VDDVVEYLSSETKEDLATMFSMDEFEKWHQSIQFEDEGHSVECLTNYRLLLGKVFLLRKKIISHIIIKYFLRSQQASCISF